MGREVLSTRAYRAVAEAAEAAGSSTHRGEQRQREGKGLHPLVDPSGYDLIRRSISYLEPKKGQFVLLRGVAMLIEDLLDRTGSMGGNVEIAMRVLPTAYKLLATGPQAVLKRYDTQIITAIFGDVQDNYVLGRSQAEMDERIAEQMTLMFPEHDGGDTPEDPEYGLFGAAYLTAADINRYGLRSYHFTVSDAPGRGRMSSDNLIRVFGKTVFERTTENGFQVDRGDLPTTKEIVTELLKRAHSFFLQIGNNSETSRFWTSVYGRDRVVNIANTEQLALVQAAIIGLTEGTLDLQSVREFLTAEAANTEVESVIRAVSGIPIGSQAVLPNFGKLPKRGDIFAKKGDLWPIEAGTAQPDSAKNKKPGIKWK